MGIITYGTGNEAKIPANATVRDQDSVGFVVAGEQNAFRNKGNINVGLNGTGALVRRQYVTGLRWMAILTLFPCGTAMAYSAARRA